MNTLRKTWIWLCRFRKRKGYGVHSPFAYDFIRTVLNEKGMYYAYDELKPLRKGAKALSSQTVDKLLFRLANFLQPPYAIKVGEGGSLSLNYIQAGCHKTKCLAFSSTEDAIQYLSGMDHQSMGLLYICGEQSCAELLDVLVPLADAGSAVILDSPYCSEKQKKEWGAMEKDPRFTLTFDLYEVGIALFCPTYSKQHYKVNFV